MKEVCHTRAHDSIYMKCPEQANLQRQIDQNGRGEEGEWECEVTTNGYGLSFRDDKNVLKLTVVMVTQLCEYTKAIK